MSYDRNQQVASNHQEDALSITPPPSYDFMPKRKLGILYPLAVIDNSPFEFYRMVKDVMLVGAGVGLQEFSAADVKRVAAQYLDLDQSVTGWFIPLVPPAEPPVLDVKK